jgi:tetratricopeptide (TPR) repeat protein
MTHEHPERGLLERFLRNDTDATENREIVRHLITGCPECQKVIRSLWVLEAGEAEALRRKLSRPGRHRHGAADRASDVFEDIAGKTLARAGDLAASRRAAPHRVEELEALSPSDRLARAVAGKRYLELPVGERILERAQRSLETRAAEALPWAELAMTVAERLDPGIWGSDGVATLRCRAWCALGEARRLVHDPEGAERALAAAEALLGPGDDERLGAEVSYYKARLRIDQNRFDEAGQLIARVVSTCRRTDDRLPLCRALILEGALHNWTGKNDEALERLRESLGLLDRRAEPRLSAEAFYRLVPLLEDPEEALAALRESQALYEQLGDLLNLARLRRLEGKVEELRGQFAAAEVHLNEARKGLLSEGRGREAAQASLDLALLYSRQGKALDTHQIARWTFPVFSAKSVQRETIFALLVLQWEAESDRINPAFIHEIARYLDPAPRPSSSGLSSVH